MRSKVRGWWENDAFQLDFLNEVLSFLFPGIFSFFHQVGREAAGKNKRKFHRNRTEAGREVGAELEEIIKTIPADVIDVWKTLGEMVPTEARKKYLEEFKELLVLQEVK